MITENLSTLKIHKLTQEQYDRELAAGRIDENALYFTPDKGVGVAGKNGYSIFTCDTTITEIEANKAIVSAAYLRWHDNRGFQINDLVLDNTNNNLWRITGKYSDQTQGIQLELEFVTCLNSKDGADGKSAYEYAQESGYEGTEAEFTEDINPDNINSFIATELAKRGQLKPEFAQTIEDCADTSKLYVLPDGMIYAYMYTEVAVGGYTNIADSTNSDFKAASRVNANKQIVSGTSTSFVSPVFALKAGDVIRMKGITKGSGTTGTTPQWGIIYYNSSDAATGYLGMFAEPPSSVGCAAGYKYWNVMETSADGVSKWTVAIDENNSNNLPSGAVKARIFGVATNGFENVIVTVNEEIRELEIVKDYQWASTGHTFVPADYEDRIVDLEAEDVKIRQEIVTAKAETDSAIADLQEQIDSGAASAKSGARWFALGDSITEGYASVVDATATNGYRYFVTEPQNRWVNIVAEKNGYVLTNKGIGGTGYLQNTQNARALTDTINFAECDFVTLAYGVNDWKYAVNIGSMADDIETGGSMVANMRYVIKKILTDNPYCKIFVITPINCCSYGTYDTNWGINYKGGTGGHLNGLGLQDIFDRMKEVCDYHGIELIDMTHSSVVNRENIKTVLADYIHPTVECHKAMARELSKKISFQ